MIAAEKVVQPKNIAMLCALKVRKVKLGILLSGLRSNLDPLILFSAGTLFHASYGLARNWTHRRSGAIGSSVAAVCLVIGIITPDAAAFA
jgi:hypothetical protein